MFSYTPPPPPQTCEAKYMRTVFYRKNTTLSSDYLLEFSLETGHAVKP